MIVKNVSYTDYKGVKREEEFYFNLSKAEIAEMELSHNGGLSSKIDRIVAAQDSNEIIALFKDLMTRSYGVVSDDGRRFIKSKELKEEFTVDKKEVRGSDNKAIKISNEKLKKKFPQFTFTPINEGIKLTYAHIKAHTQSNK